jgi:glycosyltransferase involved in cell wall biosynthesis
VSRSLHLIILTLMMPKGTTGVQTHFNAIAAYANASGLKVSMVYPHQYNRWLRKVPGAINRFLNQVNPEAAVLVDRAFCRIFLKLLLKKALSSARDRDEPVVIYAQDPWSARAALDLRRQGYHFRLVGVVHFNISEAQEYVEKGIADKNGKLWHSLMANERYVLPKLDQIIFVSGFMQRVVSARLPELSGVPQAVLSNFPLPIVKVDGESDFPPSDLIAIGTLEARKNQGFLLQVLAECNAMGKRYSLTVVGDGPDRAVLAEQVANLGLTGQVHFLGYQPDAARLIPGHKAFVHASRMESQGIVLLEALRAAVPVFAAPVGGIPEVFNDGNEGYYLNLDNPRDAAEKLISILEDQQKWQQMSICAQGTYISRFHPDVLGRRWISALLGT